MVDIHSHILPGVDDGAPSVEVALAMCRMAAADGIRHLVATPHANDEYTYDREGHQQRLDALQAELGDTIELSLGCDFHLSFENLEDFGRTPAKYTINGTRYLLVEFSDFALPPILMRSAINLLSTGITPIITHPERNLVLQKRPEHILEMAAAGCVIQVTANSVTGYWGQQASKTTDWLLKRNAVHVVATDAHNLKNRPPLLSQARAALTASVGAEVAEALVSANPRAIVGDQHLPYFPELE